MGRFNGPIRNSWCTCACRRQPKNCKKKVWPKCYPRGGCAPGYMKRIKGLGNAWKCGMACKGGIARTDNKCNCVCIKNPTPDTKVWGWECTPQGKWKNLYEKLN